MKKANKILKKTVVMTLAILMCAIVVFSAAGCSNKNYNQINSLGDVSGGLHQINATKTDRKIVNNGETDYVFVVADKIGEVVETVVADLNSFIFKSTGCKLPIKKVSEVTYSADAKVICIGNNSYSQAAGVEYQRSNLGANGYRIVTKGDSVFMGGVTEYADSNAMYEFLKHTIGFGAYGANALIYNESPDAYLYNFDIAEKPDFEWRRSSSGSMNSPSINTRRLRFNNSQDAFLDFNGADVHNFEFILPPSKYYNDHKGWYSDDKTQICLSAHGDEAELELLYNEVFNVMKNELIAKPEREIVSFTQNDKNTWCNCATCKASRIKYGTDAAILIQFCNKISEMLDAWLLTNNDGLPRDKEIQVCFFAYQKTETAPVKLNSDGTYSPIDETVICNDHVNVFIALLDASYVVPLNVGNNKQYTTKLEQWKTLSPETYLWMYQTNYRNYLYPYHSINTMPENYRIAHSYNTTFMFNQGQYGQNLSTGFNELKVFLDSKLQWNINLKMQDLIDEYFTNVYMEAAKPMQDYYNSLYTWLDYVHTDLGLSGGVYAAVNRAEYWPVRMLESFMQKVDKAYESIEKYKTTNTSLYNELYDRICLESIFPRYALATIHTGNYSDVALYNLRKQLSEDITRFSIDLVEEGGSMQEVLASWNV